MANTYTQIYVHVVFAVQGRQNLIRPEHNDELQKYMSGTVRNLKSKMIAINNMPDHVHLLIGLKPDMALSELVGKVKAAASAFIRKQQWVAGRFEWQEGFGAFSYSHSQLSTVIRYIQNQQQHHKRRTFMEEYQALLERFAVRYDAQYLFKPVSQAGAAETAACGETL